MLGHHHHASETPFKWRFAGWLADGPLTVVFLINSKKAYCQSWNPSDKIFWICACVHSYTDITYRYYFEIIDFSVLKDLITELRRCGKYEDCDITALANKYGLR